jgi:twinkle protein
MHKDSLSCVTTADFHMEHGVSLEHLEWFQTRGISEKTLHLTKIYSGRHQKTGDSFTVHPDPNGRVLVFPYFRHGEEVNAKYRAAGKKFYQKPNGLKTFWNADVLEEPCLKDGSVSLVITEGEMDALAVLECEYPYVVSVPDGAPPPVVNGNFQTTETEDIDPEHDTKYGYIFNNWEALKPIRRIIIATDDDEPGRRLAEELVRRLGRVRCQFVSYPVECKDLNEVLIKYGKEKVNEVLRYAKPYPVSGVYTFSELPPEPDLCPLKTGWGRLDQYLRPFYPAFMVVTGTAGSGKSTWVNQLVAQMSILHGISVGIASFEMRINPFVSEVLLNTAQDMGQSNPKDWLEDRFVFIAPEPADINNEFNIDWLIEKAEAAVVRYGIRILVIDPWNEIEHAVRRLENHSDYIGRAIRALKRFGREFDVLVIVVAHPAKYGAQKEPEDITLYDVADTAHFANKADFGVVIARVGGEFAGNYVSNIMIKKVRYQPVTGNLGSVSLVYDPKTRTFGQ